MAGNVVMLPRTYLWSRLVKFLELVAIFFAFAVGAWLIHETGGGEPFTRALFLRKAGFELALYIGAWLFITAELGIYRIEGDAGAARTILALSATATTCLFVAALGNRLFGAGGYPFRELLVFWGVHVGILVVTRAGLPLLIRHARTRFRYRNILLAGSSDRGFEAVRRHVEREIGQRLVGYVDLPGYSAEEQSIAGLERLGSIEDLCSVLSSRVIDEVVLAVSPRSHLEEIEEIVKVCAEAGVAVRTPVMLPAPEGVVPRIVAGGTIPMLQFSYYPDRSFELLLKRCIDIALAIVLLVLLAPVFLVIITVMILMDSSGPVFFLQERLGYHNRRFRLLKFRTMVPSAETIKPSLMSYNEMDGPVFKMRDDPRVTRVGRILRRLSLDEIPQLLNVIKGDMSLVGPRPPVPEEVESYSWRQRRRLSVRPGITGLWQVGGRNDISFDEWVELDLQYIDKWSLGMDFRILLRTVSAVVGGRGAM